MLIRVKLYSKLLKGSAICAPFLFCMIFYLYIKALNMNQIHNFLILILVSVSINSFSQNDIAKFGFKAGVNFSSIASGQFNTPGTPRTGILIGFVTEMTIAPEISFSPEIVYSHQGNLTRIESAGLTSTIKTNLNYINLPLLFKYYLNEKFAIDLGPYVGFNVISKEVNKGAGGSNFSDIDGVNFIDSGLAGSISYNIGQDYFFSARYSRGITSVFTNTADGLGLRAKNSVFNLSFGLYL
ncbi:hypothetical protein SCB49_12544 [unidentified eubacterium SCB49]|nr:hypothetical protein SCB49_12544 [unidentified eubacterium SCB49]